MTSACHGCLTEQATEGTDVRIAVPHDADCDRRGLRSWPPLVSDDGPPSPSDPFDGPVEANERGGKQSSSPYFFRGLPPLALMAVARVLKLGAGGDPATGKAGYEADPWGNVRERNWHKISEAEHVEHVAQHWVAYLKDGQVEHLTHMATRALFAVHMHYVEHPEETP